MIYWSDHIFTKHYFFQFIQWQHAHNKYSTYSYYVQISRYSDSEGIAGYMYTILFRWPQKQYIFLCNQMFSENRIANSAFFGFNLKYTILYLQLYSYTAKQNVVKSFEFGYEYTILL